jgi:hypothetical protein
MDPEDEAEIPEIFEYWLVSEWLAKKLADAGEAVILDFYGRSVWGRCTTGQACYMDHVIAEIYFELTKEAIGVDRLAEELGIK